MGRMISWWLLIGGGFTAMSFIAWRVIRRLRTDPEDRAIRRRQQQIERRRREIELLEAENQLLEEERKLRGLREQRQDAEYEAHRRKIDEMRARIRGAREERSASGAPAPDAKTSTST